MSEEESKIDQNEVRGTANDAARCKSRIQKLGYYKDKYIKYFAKDNNYQQPIISRGYYIRVQCFTMIIESFLKKYNNNCSIINLGAGFDTLYFRLKEANNLPKLLLELDMKENVNKKRKIYEHSEELKGLLPAYDESDHEKIITDSYCLIPCNMMCLEEFKRALELSHINLNLPVLLLAECVFIYIAPHYVNDLLSYITSQTKQASIAVFEQIRPDDAFGKVMIESLIERKCPLMSIHEYPDTKSQIKRYLDHGFHYSDSQDLYNLYYNFIPKEEIQRISRLEFFDEYEEWFLMQTHYCVTVASQEDILGTLFPIRHDKCPKISSFQYMS